MGQTKRELVQAVLQGRPADRVPVGFWHHFLQDQRHADALSDPAAWDGNIQGHEAFCRSWDPDFLKIMTDGFFLYPHPELHELRSIRDAAHIRPLGHSSPWIQKQIELCRILTGKYKDRMMIFYNLFSPARCIEFQQTGDNAKTAVVQFMKEDPEALKYVMEVLAEDVADLAQSVIREGGADGVYLSVQNIPSPEMTEEKYNEFIAPSEIQVLQAANEASSDNILHICGYMGCHNDLSWYKKYPFEAVNWAVVFEGVPLEEGKKIFGGRCVIGGFDNTEQGVLYRGSRTEIEEETRRILSSSGRTGVILGADCTVPKDIDSRRFDWVRDAAAR